MTIRPLVLAMVLTVGGVVVSAATIKEIRLADGSDEGNKISSPLYDTSGAPGLKLTVKSAYDRKPKFVRRVPAAFMAPKGPEYDLDPKVDIAQLLTDALKAEAMVMGFKRASAGEPAWRVNGTIMDVYLESRQVYMGATLFYGYLDIEFQMTGPSGVAHQNRLKVHTYSGSYNGGFGRRDEAESAAAHLMVDGAQEVIARLNRDFFKAPAHGDVTAQLNRVKAELVDTLGVRDEDTGPKRLAGRIAGKPAK